MVQTLKHATTTRTRGNGHTKTNGHGLGHANLEGVSYAQHGTGFVGQAVLRALHDVAPHISVIGVDPDQRKVLELGKKYNLQSCTPGETDGYISFQIHAFSVPTPCQPGSEWGYDLSYLLDALENFGSKVLRRRRDYTLIVIRSTVYPGTTRELLVPLLEKTSGKKCGRDFDVAYNPEFLAQETAYQDALHPPLIAVAANSDRAVRTFRTCFDQFHVPFRAFANYDSAEWLKMTNNVLNAMLISAVNELRANMVSHGVNREEANDVLNTLATTAFAKSKPTYGLNDFGPFGGACLPKETEALRSGLRARGIYAPILEAAIEVNDALR